MTRVQSLRSSELFAAARETCVRQSWVHRFCAVFFGQSITDFTNSSVLYCFRMLCNWRGAPVLLSLCEYFRVQIPHIYLPFLVEALMGESDVDPITYLVFMPS